MSHKVACHFWMLSIVLLAAAAFAQNNASIKGVVTDPKGAVVAGAKITVTGVGIERHTQTGNDGSYEVPALPPGKYSVRVETSGFATELATDVPLEVSQSSVQNF